MSIEVIVSENFSAPPHTKTAAIPQENTRHSEFSSFLSDDRKQYSPTPIAHITRIMTLLNKCNSMSATLSTIRENTDVCDEHYRLDTALYLMSTF